MQAAEGVSWDRSSHTTPTCDVSWELYKDRKLEAGCLLQGTSPGGVCALKEWRSSEGHLRLAAATCGGRLLPDPSLHRVAGRTAEKPAQDGERLLII